MVVGSSGHDGPRPGGTGDTGDRFTGLADVYAAHRPSYPGGAIAALLDGLAPPVRAADVGCGTGISARCLAAAGVRVVALDPNRDMLDRAARDHGADRAIDWRVGTAEATGLPDGAVDLVLCAQSFHWFDAAAALEEFHRILAPGGRLALVWNVRDAHAPASAAYEAIVASAQADARRRGLVTPPLRSGRPDATGRFGNVRTVSVPNDQRLDRAGLFGRARSASYYPRSGPVRETLDTRLHALFDAHAREGIVTLAQACTVTLADRLSADA